ncbi:MAG: winged helix-turn-helix domain-containing protein [Thermodesulfobacteriota bacterium]|nr:winged helix-turn-helix domain-containing protein [Thermodesulfobacteriota bacterium]
MRPIVSKQNPLRYPLNELLGTQAHVRLLRVMANEVDGPLSASDVAKRAGLTVPGAQKALGRLYKSGFISRVGGGRKHQYEIRRSDRLMQITLALFQAEKDRYDQLLMAIKREIKNLKPHPQAAWIQTFPKVVGEALTLGLLHETPHLTNGIRQLRTKLNQVEKDFDLTIELEGYTKADLFDLELEDMTLLYGVMFTPESATGQRKRNPLTHREKNRQLLALCRKLAKAIEQDTSLIRRAKDYIDRLLEEDRGTATRDLAEWRDILDMYSVQRLSRFLTSSSERAERLRQSNPFFAVLDFSEGAQPANGLEDENDT